jgi:hypothetical protein
LRRWRARSGRLGRCVVAVVERQRRDLASLGSAFVRHEHAEGHDVGRASGGGAASGLAEITARSAERSVRTGQNGHVASSDEAAALPALAVSSGKSAWHTRPGRR